MALIRKRLAVEMWIYEQLNDLHGCTVRIYNNINISINVLDSNNFIISLP